MKGIESVMRGYADGGSVNPFQEYAGGPRSYNPFAALSYLSAQGRPQYAVRPPTTILTPAVQTGGGYRDIYGNLDAIKQAQAAKKALEAAAKVVPEAPGGPGEAGGGAGGGGFSSTPPGTPGSGFNVPGVALGGAGLLAGIPGVGAAGTALGAAAANEYLSQLGLAPTVSTLEALKSGLSFGIFGQSPQSQADETIGAAIEKGELDPDVVDFINEKLAGPSIPQQYGAQVATGQRSATGAFFDAINDYNTVGKMSEIIAAIEQAERDRLAANQAEIEKAESRDIMAGAGTGPGVDINVEPGQGPPGSPGADPAGSDGGDVSGETGGPPGGWAQGGYVPGKSGGMDDDVPAVIDGKQPARLSSGEFVFDAATVAALGDGNNQAGAKKLDGLRKAIRKKAYGHEKQPPQNYSVGDLVRMYDRGR